MGFSPIFSSRHGDCQSPQSLQERIDLSMNELSILACYPLRGAILISASVVFLL